MYRTLEAKMIGHDTGLVDLQWNVGRRPSVHASSDDTLRVLDRNTTLALLDGDDRDDHEHGDEDQARKTARRLLLVDGEVLAGRVEMIEVKIRIDIPLPMPRCVTSSPSHMTRRSTGGQGQHDERHVRQA